MSATDAEMEILRHSLGLRSSTKAYRNHFAASKGHADMKTLRSLVVKGLMTVGHTSPSGMTFYHVTDAGCALCGTTRAEAER